MELFLVVFISLITCYVIPSYWKPIIKYFTSFFFCLLPILLVTIIDEKSLFQITFVHYLFKILHSIVYDFIIDIKVKWYIWIIRIICLLSFGYVWWFNMHTHPETSELFTFIIILCIVTFVVESIITILPIKEEVKYYDFRRFILNNNVYCF